jgi:hypothetical protein
MFKTVSNDDRLQGLTHAKQTSEIAASPKAKWQ